jgi:hypothetical protein
MPTLRSTRTTCAGRFPHTEHRAFIVYPSLLLVHGAGLSLAGHDLAPAQLQRDDTTVTPRFGEGASTQ